ncbi:MAG: acyl-ACP--UDP-N-acetylglucosamine O-acyltransferase [Gemmataceae bacterium]
MPSDSDRVHPTAIIDPQARLAHDVSVGPFAIVEGPVRLGPGSVVRARAHLVGPLDAGQNNEFGINTVIGDKAQHLLYADEPGRVEIGDGNTFREGVTIHRSTIAGGATRIGNGNYLMGNSHVAHDCHVGNECIFANSALLGGHVVIGDRAFLSGNVGVQQFVRIGRLAMVSAGASAMADVPPFAITEGRNTIIGVNLVGLRRAGLSPVQINAVRRAYRLLLHSGLIPKLAAARLDKELGHIDVVAELVAFIRESKKGVCFTRARRARDRGVVGEAA